MFAMIGLIVGLWTGSTTVWAQVWTVPSDLSPGAKYRVVFVTGKYIDEDGQQQLGTIFATSDKIADYNALVTKVAGTSSILRSFSTTWKAIASTGTVSARDNTSTNFTEAAPGLPVYMLFFDDLTGAYTGKKVAGSYKDLWDGAIAAPINVTQSFATLTAADGSGVWTGTTTSGFSDGSQALGASSQVRIGESNQSDANWIYNLAKVSTESRHLYAMSGELSAIPEPSGLALGFALAVAGAAWSTRYRKRKSAESTNPAPS
jgi:hypothetical protein